MTFQAVALTSPVRATCVTHPCRGQKPAATTTKGGVMRITTRPIKATGGEEG